MVAMNPALSRKLLYALEYSGVKKAHIARACGISTAAVSQAWIQRGQIDKKHFSTLYRMTGFPSAWWADDNAPLAPPMTAVAWRIALAASQREITAQMEKGVIALIETCPERSPPPPAPHDEIIIVVAHGTVSRVPERRRSPDDRRQGRLIWHGPERRAHDRRVSEMSQDLAEIG